MSRNGRWCNRLLRFDPVLKPRLWGGCRLRERFARPVPDGVRIGESWELFAFAGHSARVCAGAVPGQALSELVTSGCVGVHPSYAQRGIFPLLFKWIDAADVLSVQVHPPDGHPSLPPDSCGKTECWVVVEADQDATLYVGTRPGTSRQDLEEAIREGHVADVLAAHHPRPGDVYFVPAGTVHAIGAGVMLAEIQQASDITFRLYDWGRIDPSTGQPRPLHVDEGLACIRYEGNAGRVEPRTVLRSEAIRVERLVPATLCHAFVLDRITASRRVEARVAEPWSVWMVVSGRGVVAVAERRELLKPGDTVLVLGPAAASIHPVQAPLTLLETRLPSNRPTVWLE